MSKYIPFLSLLLTLSVGTPLCAQTSKTTTKQVTTNPSLTARVKKYQDWLIQEGYRPVKKEDDEWIWLEFKSEGGTFNLGIDKDSEWVYLRSGLSFNEEDKSPWWTRMYATNQTNLEYRAVKVYLGETEEDGTWVDFSIWAIAPKSEYIESYLEIINAAKKSYEDTYSDAVKLEAEEAKKQSETKKK